MTYEEFIFKTIKNFPKFKIKKKSDSKLLNAIALFLFIITFGKFKKENFLNNFITTIGYTVYVNDNWFKLSDNSKLEILIHETTHMEQYKKEGILFALKYCLWYLPLGFADFRLHYEIEAYAKQIVHNYLNNNAFLYGPYFENTIKWLSGPEYFWPTFSKNKVRRELRKEIIKQLKERK